MIALVISTCCCLLMLLAGSQFHPVEAAAVATNPEDDQKYYDFQGKEVKFGGGSGARMSVHSGTKWCGAGNIARDFNDLGSAFETDKCCRQHDYCGVYLRPNEEKYNFKNTFLYTLSHCECDNNFLSCLQASRDAQARSVQFYFFYSLRMPCFSLVPKKTCVRRSWWDKIMGGCSQYEDKETAVLMRLPQVDTTRDAPAPPPPLEFRTSRK